MSNLLICLLPSLVYLPVEIRQLVDLLLNLAGEELFFA